MKNKSKKVVERKNLQGKITSKKRIKKESESFNTEMNATDPGSITASKRATLVEKGTSLHLLLMHAKENASSLGMYTR